MLASVRRVAVAVTCALVAAWTVVAPASAATSTPSNIVTVQGRGGWLLEYGELQATPSGTWKVTVADPHGWDTFEIEAGQVYLSVAAPRGRPRLEVGRYTSFVHADHDVARFDISVGSRACGGTHGHFDVLALTRDAGGDLTSLALDYSATCGTDPPVLGSLRWNSPEPFTHTAAPRVQLPDTAPGVSRTGTVTFTNTGTVPQTLGAARWIPDLGSSRYQSPVTITRDTCAGRTLPRYGRCVVDVRFVIDSGHVDGYVVVPDGTLRGLALAQVRAWQAPTPSAVVLRATPLRGGVLLSSPGHGAQVHRVLRSAGDGREVEVADGVRLPWTDTDVAQGLTYGYRVVPRSGGLTGPASNRALSGPLPVPVGHEGTFVPVGPVRVLDTRTGQGAPAARVTAGRTLRFDPAAGDHVPRTGVLAVVLNVTATDATRSTHLRVGPAGGPRPRFSSVRPEAGHTRSSQVVVPLGDGGAIDISVDAGSSQVVADLQGFYSARNGPRGSGYSPVDPTRVLDTRTWPYITGGMRPGLEYAVPISRLIGVAPAAVEVSIKVTQPVTGGRLTAWSGDGPAPRATTLHFRAGETVANRAIVPVTIDSTGTPQIKVRHDARLAHVVIDVVGAYSAEDPDQPLSFGRLRYMPVPATRIADTRRDGAGHRLAGGATLTVPRDVLPPATAHLFRLTATGAPASGYLTAWSTLRNHARPPTSAVSFRRATASASLATTEPAVDGGFAVTASGAPVHVAVDHLGYFY